MINNKLKVFRAMHDLTQDDLAQKANVSRQTINAIETGKYLPSLPLALTFAKFFKINIEEIFYED